MRLEKKCVTCFHNQRQCSYSPGLFNGCLDCSHWTPYTNLEYLKSLSAKDFVEWMNRCRHHGIHGLICEDADWGCWFWCKHNHYCETENGLTDKAVILKWLNSPVEVDYEMSVENRANNKHDSAE